VNLYKTGRILVGKKMFDLTIPKEPIYENQCYYLDSKVCLVGFFRMEKIPVENLIDEIISHEILHGILKNFINEMTSLLLDNLACWGVDDLIEYRVE